MGYFYFRPFGNNSFPGRYPRQCMNPNRVPCSNNAKKDECCEKVSNNRTCYNEDDYRVSHLDDKWAKYGELGNEADIAIMNSLIKMKEAVECLKKGIALNEEANGIWCQMTEWLDRYYHRFGCYNECEKMRADRGELMDKSCAKQHEALEHACEAISRLEESGCIDRALTDLECRMRYRCFPKC